jgi:hypothetical protein
MRTKEFMILTLTAAFSIATPSLALNITFAQFTQQNSDRVLDYSNTGTANVMSVVDAPVNFVIQAFGTPGIYSAVLNIQAISSATVVDTGPQFEQVGWSGFYSFTDGATNYLTVNFTNAITDINSLGGSGSMFRTSPLGLSIDYTSDVLDLSNLVAADFSLAFSAVTPPYGIEANSFGTPFTASVAGTFAGEEAGVPEPSAWAMLLMGFGLTGLAVRRRRTSLVTVAA